MCFFPTQPTRIFTRFQHYRSGWDFFVVGNCEVNFRLPRCLFWICIKFSIQLLKFVCELQTRYSSVTDWVFNLEIPLPFHSNISSVPNSTGNMWACVCVCDTFSYIGEAWNNNVGWIKICACRFPPSLRCRMKGNILLIANWKRWEDQASMMHGVFFTRKYY